MWVCICEAVTSTAIKAAIGGGARTPRQVGEMCGAGTVCGKCKANIMILLAEEGTGSRRPDEQTAKGRLG